jgi:hypothetical protein
MPLAFFEATRALMLYKIEQSGTSNESIVVRGTCFRAIFFWNFEAP